MGFAAVQHHLYDAQGERGLKGLGTITEFYVNGETKGYGASLGNYVRYVSGYFVVDGHGRVSKHYYARSELVVSRLAGDVAGYLEAEDLEGEQLSTLRSRQQRDVQAAIKTWDLQIFPFLNYPKPPDNCSLYPTGSEDHKQCVCDQQNTCTEVLYWYHPDHLGSSTFLSDAAGEPYQFVLYLPFGETFTEQRAAEWSTPYLFNAKELDTETGLYYYSARYYDPRVSMWWGVDPLARERDWLTPYNYVQNNPINRIDPTGALDDPIHDSRTGKFLGHYNDSNFDGEIMLMDNLTYKMLTGGRDVVLSPDLAEMHGTYLSEYIANDFDFGSKEDKVLLSNVFTSLIDQANSEGLIDYNSSHLEGGKFKIGISWGAAHYYKGSNGDQIWANIHPVSLSEYHKGQFSGGVQSLFYIHHAGDAINILGVHEPLHRHYPGNENHKIIDPMVQKNRAFHLTSDAYKQHVSKRMHKR